MTTELPFLDLPAHPVERGRAHGEALKAPIRASYERYLGRILAAPGTRRRGVDSEEAYLAFAARHIAPCEAYAPQLMRELAAVAEAADLTLPQVMSLNLHLELLDLANGRSPDPAPGGCTSFALQRSGEEEVVIGQTYDLWYEHEDAAFCFRTPLEDGRTLTALSFAGTLGAAGMSGGAVPGCGLAIVINKLYGANSRIGVAYPFILRRMLEAASPGRAVSLLLSAERAGSMHYLLGDGRGLAYGLETSARRFELLEPGPDGLYAHSNHFLGTGLKALELRDFGGHAGHTVTRHARARQLLRRLGRNAPAEALKGVMDDRHGFPCGISAVPVEADPPFESKTVARVLLEPAAGRASYARGNDGANPWRCLDIGGGGSSPRPAFGFALSPAGGGGR